jgi:hypothetical protein
VECAPAVQTLRAGYPKRSQKHGLVFWFAPVANINISCVTSEFGIDEDAVLAADHEDRLVPTIF